MYIWISQEEIKMLDEYRIEPLSVGQYLDGVESEDIKIDQAVQKFLLGQRDDECSYI